MRSHPVDCHRVAGRLLAFGGVWMLGLGLAAGETLPTRGPTASSSAMGRSIPGLAGSDSPYLGHTGSWDGKGGGIFGSSKIPDLDREVAMGLRWTFMPVHWRAMEPRGPVDPEKDVPPAWEALDRFVIAAHERGLNILMQAPVIGGNAGGPPDWAGRREPGKSAPADMAAVAAFAGKLARRYRPGGALARREGWRNTYGVRAWELDNEPDSYRTHWKGQAADYAEFAALVGQAIHAEDAGAVIVLPGTPVGARSLAWLEAALDAYALRGSPAFRRAGKPFSIGPVTDTVSFHLYEGLDSFFSGEKRTVDQALSEVREVFERWSTRAEGFEFAPPRAYWHTEGNYDFVGLMAEHRRAAWRVQFMTRAFAAGVDKVCVMDAAPKEQAAVTAYVVALPNPFPMFRETDASLVTRGRAMVFRHPDGLEPDAGQVWVAWAEAGQGDALVELPVRRGSVRFVYVDGAFRDVTVKEGRVRVALSGDEKMAPPILVVDRAPAN